MRRIYFIAWWSFLGAAALVASIQYLHPATFSRSALPVLLGLAFLSSACAIANKRYE